MKRPTPPEVSIDDLPGFYIRRLHQISVGIFLGELSEVGITPVQFGALQTVASHPGIDQRTLARTIALDTSTIGGVVDRLEQRGWLERKSSPEDRRVRQLWLTPTGLQLLAQAQPATLRTQNLILAPLTERQRKDFMHLLRLLVDKNNEHSRAPIDTAR